MERTWRERFFHYIPDNRGFNKMFTIIYTFSGRGFDLADFSKKTCILHLDKDFHHCYE